MLCAATNSEFVAFYMYDAVCCRLCLMWISDEFSGFVRSMS